jgi:hypothetical protein
MKTIIRIFTITCVIGLHNLDNLAAQTESITFAVNMEFANLDPGDQVVVRGNHAQLGNWEAEGELKLRHGNYPNVYRGNIRLNHSKAILYKYVIKKADGTEIWEQSGNRHIEQSKTEPDLFSNRSSPGITQLFVNVTVQLDLTEHSMNGLPAEGVSLMGMHDPLGFDLENERTEMVQINDGIWQTTVSFPFGTPHDVPFKFAYNKEGDWIWEWRPGHSNHVFLIDDSGTEQTILLRYDIDLPGIVPVSTTEGFVDNYEYVIGQLGENGPHSRYGYELAMHQLKAGNRLDAVATYQAYRTGNPGGEEIDDFDYEMAYHILETQGTSAAESYVLNKLASETISERRSYLRYLQGELALNDGNDRKARRLFRQARQQSEWDLVTEYSQRALINSYLQDSSTDSVELGMRMLRRLTRQAQPEYRRNYEVQLARVYSQLGMMDEQENILNKLATNGNPRQQIRGKLKLADFYMDQGRYTESLGLFDAIEFSMVLPDEILVQISRYRIQGYFNLEMYAEVIDTYQLYADNWPNDVFKNRLELLYNEALDHLGTDEFLAPELNAASIDSTQN